MRWSRTVRFALLGLILLLGAAACTPTAAVTPAPLTSLWGPIITFGQAAQTDAPALWPNGVGLWLVWIGADAGGVHQDTRTLTAKGLSQTVVQPLPPIHPYAQQVMPAGDDNLHLLWLDDNGSGETRLYDAEISSALELDRGPTLVSEQSAHRFTVVPGEDGDLWVISSGGLVAEPDLYIRDVDAVGRPRLADNDRLVEDADWPTAVRRNDGTVDLFWIAPSDGQVFHAGLKDGETQNPQSITSTVPLDTGDRLDSFSAALDSTHAYLFWNITRANGQSESWMTSAPLDTATWKAPARLSVDTTLTTPYQTGFNSGSVQMAQAGSTPFAWAKPLDTQSDVLPVAGTLDKTHLALLYLKDGQITGVQIIAATAGLLGTPNLKTDQNRDLYLAWAEPAALDHADLNLTMTRSF